MLACSHNNLRRESQFQARGGFIRAGIKGIYCINCSNFQQFAIQNLDIELDRLKKRLDDLDARGVVIAPGLTLDALYAERQALYVKYADITVKTDGLTPEQVVREILANFWVIEY